MKKTIVKFGIYGLLVGFVVFTLHLFLGINKLEYNTNEILGYISIFISLSFIFFGIKHYRNKQNNGFITFGKTLKIVLAISFLVAIGIAAADFIYTKFINPSFFQIINNN